MKAMPNNQRLFGETNSIDYVQPSSIDCYYDLILFRYDEFIRSDRLLAATRWQSDEQITHQSLSHCGLLFLVSLHCPLSRYPRIHKQRHSTEKVSISLSLFYKQRKSVLAGSTYYGGTHGSNPQLKRSYTASDQPTSPFKKRHFSQQITPPPTSSADHTGWFEILLIHGSISFCSCR